MKRCAYHKPFGWRQDTTPRHPEKTSIRLSLFRMFMWKPRTQTPTCWVRKIEISLGLGWWNSAKNHVSKKEVLHRKCQAKQIRGHSKATFKLVIFLGGGGWTSWILWTMNDTDTTYILQSEEIKDESTSFSADGSLQLLWNQFINLWVPPPFLKAPLW